MLVAGRRALRRIWLRIGRFIGFVFKRDGRWWIALIVVTVATGVGLSWRFWGMLHSQMDSLSTTISNLSFVLGGIVAIELALWRSIVGERQTSVAQQQAETVQRGLLNERFQKGAEMLGSEDLSVRLGGIYALKHLAAEHPGQHHVQVMELLCAFVRHPTRDKGGSANLNEERQSPRADVNAVAEIICNRGNSHLLLERNAGFKLDLCDADLRRISLTQCRFVRGLSTWGESFRRLTNEGEPDKRPTCGRDFFRIATTDRMPVRRGWIGNEACFNSGGELFWSSIFI